MARRRSAAVRKSGGTTIVTVPAAAPVARRSRRRSVARASGRRRSHRRSRSHSGGSAGGMNRMLGAGVGGFAVGFLEKTFPNLPTLPLVGRKGAIAIAAYFLRGKHPLIADVGMAAAAISGYELGSTGHISGDVMGEGIASQM